MAQAGLEYVKKDNTLFCEGIWTIHEISALKAKLSALVFKAKTSLVINAEGIQKIDPAGSLFFQQLLSELEQKRIQVTHLKAKQSVNRMLSLVAKTKSGQNLPQPEKRADALFYFVGYETHRKWRQCLGFLALLGELFIRFFQALKQWRRFHFKSILTVMELSGFQALPILGLLSFLIGIVLTYQMGLQLKTYGANIYIVFLTGMTLQREFAPLMTAIIVAGRTGSAITAQLGSMKVNEEIAALTVMGLAPSELLILPKILAMILVFPILIFWSDVFGTLGAMVMSKAMLDINYSEFLIQLQQSLGARQYWLGLVKGPVFALLIALVGAFQGFQVKGSANSVGFFTTKSVVQAIFLIIIADAAFSILYTSLDV